MGACSPLTLSPHRSRGRWVPAAAGVGPSLGSTTVCRGASLALGRTRTHSNRGDSRFPRAGRRWLMVRARHRSSSDFPQKQKRPRTQAESLGRLPYLVFLRPKCSRRRTIYISRVLRNQPGESGGGFRGPAFRSSRSMISKSVGPDAGFCFGGKFSRSCLPMYITVSSPMTSVPRIRAS